MSMPKLPDRYRGRRVKRLPPLFPEHQLPRGHLMPNRENHALFYYYLIAYREYQRWQGELVEPARAGYETRVREPAWRTIYESIAAAYGVDPDGMARAWPNIDAECERCNMPLLPQGERYRFDRIGTA